MEYKNLILREFKQSGEGTFQGWLSVYNNVDDTNEIVAPGAFKKNLLEQGNMRVMLWQHRTDSPIGELMLEDREQGLWCTGQLLMSLPEAQKAYLLMKARIVKGLSIGFVTIRDAIENGVRKLLELKLFEGSIVCFPANQQAQIATVKMNPTAIGTELRTDEVLACLAEIKKAARWR
jgi:uncharacterized protein